MLILAEAKRRGVLRVATVYLVVAWLALEVGQALFNIFELPHLGLQVLFVVMAIGFPIAVAAAWYYRFGASAAEGEAHRDEHNRSAQIAAVFGAVALLAVAVAIGVRYFGMGKGGAAKGHGEEQTVAAETAGAARTRVGTIASTFAPPEHSIAVLPFVNMSGDPKEDYFSDGLSEELLNSLARVDALQVAARTSSFSFKDEHVDIRTIARKLNVGAVLEGSVRKAGGRVRITAQLVNAVSGYHLWSETYDRDLRDIFALQTEIAEAVTKALEVTLLQGAIARIELGGTRNPDAFDAYLRGLKHAAEFSTEAATNERLAAYAEALTLDPKFALAYAAQARTYVGYAGIYATGTEAIHDTFRKARVAAEKAVALAPELGEAHASLALVLDWGYLDFTRAAAEYERARHLGPGSAEVLRAYGIFLSQMGRSTEGITAARRAVTLDPVNTLSHRSLGSALLHAGQFAEAIAAFRQAESLDTRKGSSSGWIGVAFLALGQPESARAACVDEPIAFSRNTCLAITYHQLNRQADAEKELAALRADNGDDAAYQYAQIYTQWGNQMEALQWLETAYRLRDPGLIALRTDPLLDPIRSQPKFKRLERELKFPG